VKKVVILGSTGMVGHMVYQYLESLNKYDLLGVSRMEAQGIKNKLFDVEENLKEFLTFLCMYKPDVVINCIGLLVQSSQKNPSKAIFLNSLLPHLLKDICTTINSKLIHISTDCLFDGRNGPYTENDLPTERNWYGRSKALGEVMGGRILTLRTSIIGPELKSNGSGLFEWFMGQKGEIEGYTKVYWNGITTLELAKQIDKLLNNNLENIYNLTSSFSISKYDLLVLIKRIWFRNDVNIIVNSNIESNKTLLNNRIEEYDPQIPSYEVQLEELKNFNRSLDSR
jgi:dTDP-4-dehydrorhamnose reductase